MYITVYSTCNCKDLMFICYKTFFQTYSKKTLLMKKSGNLGYW